MKMFVTKKGRLHTIIGLERALDVCSTDCKRITGILCRDAQTGSIWSTDIKYFNPLKGDKKAWRMVMLKDKMMRDENGFFIPFQ